MRKMDENKKILGKKQFWDDNQWPKCLGIKNIIIKKIDDFLFYN